MKCPKPFLTTNTPVKSFIHYSISIEMVFDIKFLNNLKFCMFICSCFPYRIETVQYIWNTICNAIAKP